jgi:hypothetical protein
LFFGYPPTQQTSDNLPTAFIPPRELVGSGSEIALVNHLQQRAVLEVTSAQVKGEVNHRVELTLRHLAGDVLVHGRFGPSGVFNEPLLGLVCRARHAFVDACGVPVRNRPGTVLIWVRY